MLPRTRLTRSWPTTWRNSLMLMCPWCWLIVTLNRLKCTWTCRDIVCTRIVTHERLHLSRRTFCTIVFLGAPSTLLLASGACTCIRTPMTRARSKLTRPSLTWRVDTVWPNASRRSDRRLLLLLLLLLARGIPSWSRLLMLMLLPLRIPRAIRSCRYIPWWWLCRIRPTERWLSWPWRSLMLRTLSRRS